VSWREAGVVRFGELEIDLDARVVRRHGIDVAFTRREFDLLAFLVTNPHRVFSRRELLNEVWDSSPDWQVAATVTEHVRRIRLKIEDDPRQPSYIQVVRGVGYRFDGEVSGERVVGAGSRQA
jgi:two-component system, OmpR family, phosphate regulon response regulator PhoB